MEFKPLFENALKTAKSSGVLLHPLSLPGNSFCGTFGASSRKWLHLLADNGIGVWQFLPLSPPDSTGSPYSSPSSFAFNPSFLDLDDLLNEGFLCPQSLKDLPEGSNESNTSVEFLLIEPRTQLIGKALRKEWGKQSLERKQDFLNWCDKQSWLESHVQFTELRKQNGNLPWWQWTKGVSLDKSSVLASWARENEERLLESRLLQWHLDRQWQALRQLAKKLGVLLFGDLPFYVARDSSDVWANPELFSILRDGGLFMQSGVPPDYFSETGQLWGTPVYRWKKHKRTNFRWWRKRLFRHFSQVDLLRLDHFRALEAYWAVKGNDKNAMKGSWRSSPGLQLLNSIRKNFGTELPLVAEDLGVITKGVENLRDHFKLPGMKILQFAFDGNPQNPYLPENIKGSSWVVYTGTHDNPTTIGWWNNLNPEQKDEISRRFENKNGSPSWELISIGMKTEANLFVTPLQDLLSLDDESRLNTPGTIGNNWKWRIKSFDLKLIEALEKYGTLSRHHGRK